METKLKTVYNKYVHVPAPHATVGTPASSMIFYTDKLRRKSDKEGTVFVSKLRKKKVYEKLEDNPAYRDF